jgi:hypothetical protein
MMRRLTLTFVAIATLLIPIGPAHAGDSCSLPPPLKPPWCES